MNLKKFIENGYVICFPQKPKLDTVIINKLQCQLMCPVETIVIHVTTVYGYLARGISVVDENGDLVTALDDDLDKKLVIVDSDLNLWYALLQSPHIADEVIAIEKVLHRKTKF